MEPNLASIGAGGASREGLPAVLAMALGVIAAALILLVGSGSAISLASPFVECEPARTSGSSGTDGGSSLMTASNLDSMTGESDLIFSGRVRRLQSCLTQDGSIVTLVSLAADKVIKGGAGTGPVIVTVPGGTFGEYQLGTGFSPEFTVGEQVIVLTRAGAAAHDRVLTQGLQSKFSVTTEEAVAGLGLSRHEMEEKITQAVRGDLAADEDPLGDGTQLVTSSFVTSGAKWPTSSIPVPMFINAETSRPGQLSAQDTRLAAVNAIHSWQNLSDSFMASGPVANTTRVSGADGCSDGDPPDGLQDTAWGLAFAHPPGVLAVTSSCVFIPTGETIDADVEIDTDHFGPFWRVDGSGACNTGLFDLQTVLLHEYGHTLGLDHPSSTSCVSGTNGLCPVMNAVYGGVQHDPCVDDSDGAASLYPLGAGSKPAAPAGLTADPSSSVLVRWNNVANEMGFEVWRAPDFCTSATSGDFVLLDTVDNDVLTYTDTDYGEGIDPAQPYCYKVRAFNTNGESPFSNTATICPPLPPGDTFCDVTASHWAHSYVEAIANAGITSGCKANPPLYCPANSVTRDQMAVFLIRAKGETPVAPTGTVFDDVPASHWAAGYIERLAQLGITAGCKASPPLYCPDRTVSRAEMAVFIIRALSEAPVDPPTGAVFGDVPASHWAAGHIERLYELNITTGCSAGPPPLYCPASSVNRAEMAAFIARAWNLPLPP